MKAISELSWQGAPGEDLVLQRASVLDPRARISAPYDIVIREGRVAELAAPGSHELLEIAMR